MLLSQMKAELYWITAAPLGRLAIMPRPRAGDWLADELASFQSSGVDVVVSLLADDEITELDLQHEPTLCDDIGLTFISYPIADRNVPTSLDDFFAFTQQLHDYLCHDRAVAIHCRMGIGRSSLVAACLLVKSGLSATDAFDSISQDRGIDVPDTNAQIEWVKTMSVRLRNGTSAT
jgi:protein-tyrosine phosphatase